jgi:hypothetical protein
MTTTTRKPSKKITYWRDGQSYQTDKSREMPVSKAIAEAAKYGYCKVWLNSGVLENDRMVIMLSDYRPRGEEYVRLVYSRGRYPGVDCGSIYREEDKLCRK